MVQSNFDQEWISKHQSKAFDGLKSVDKSAFMEIQTSLLDYPIDVFQSELLLQARQSQIETFGWPIGLVLDRDELSPKATAEGIVAEISIKDAERRDSYDYWTLRKNGDFYLLKSIFEDERRENSIFFNTRIVRITETLLHQARLYSGLDVPKDSLYSLRIRHGGLKGRVLSTSSIARRLPPTSDRVSIEDVVYTEVKISIEQTELQLVNLVEMFTQPLFVLFNFFELNRSILEEIVNNYKEGKVV